MGWTPAWNLLARSLRIWFCIHPSESKILGENIRQTLKRKDNDKVFSDKKSIDYCTEVWASIGLDLYLSFFKDLFSLTCMYMRVCDCMLCVCGCILCVYGWLEGRRPEISCSWSYRQLWDIWCGCWELSSCLLEKEYGLLIAHPSLQYLDLLLN